MLEIPLPQSKDDEVCKPRQFNDVLMISALTGDGADRVKVIQDIDLKMIYGRVVCMCVYTRVCVCVCVFVCNTSHACTNATHD